MGKTWRTAIYSSNANLSGFSLIQLARIDENNEIYVTIPSNLIEQLTQYGTLVKKYYNPIQKEIIYILDNSNNNEEINLADIWSYSNNFIYPESWIYYNT